MEVEISQKVAAIPGTGRQEVPVTSKALDVLSQEMHRDFKGPKWKNLGKVLTLLPDLRSVSGGFSSPSRSYMEKPLCLVETPGVFPRVSISSHRPCSHMAREVSSVRSAFANASPRGDCCLISDDLCKFFSSQHKEKHLQDKHNIGNLSASSRIA